MARNARVLKESIWLSGHTAEQVITQYLPDNYSVSGSDDDYVYITGNDYAGWTMDEYVLPRLATGNMVAEET